MHGPGISWDAGCRPAESLGLVWVKTAVAACRRFAGWPCPVSGASLLRLESRMCPPGSRLIFLRQRWDMVLRLWVLGLELLDHNRTLRRVQNRAERSLHGERNNILAVAHVSQDVHAVRWSQSKLLYHLKRTRTPVESRLQAQPNGRTGEQAKTCEPGWPAVPACIP